MIKILDYTNKPLTLMGECAAICWNSKPSSRIAKECLKSGHDRVSEFADVTLEISGYSTRVIRELYTHIQGTSRLQQSTRYVDEGNFEYYIPDSIKNDSEAFGLYLQTMETIQENYKKLQFLDIPKQDIANILPLGSHTKIVLKINIRALIHMCHLRLCTRALKEYRDLMKEILNMISQINDEYKYIVDTYCVPKCEVSGYCNESHSCGRKPQREE